MSVRSTMTRGALALLALGLLATCTVSSATFTPGSDGGIHDARVDAPLVPDAEVVPDATPVQCDTNDDCLTPPTLCHMAGICGAQGVCDFAEVDCSGLTNECNVGICDNATGTCGAQPANEDNLCGAGVVLGVFGACAGFAQTCDSSGEQSRTNTRNACAAGNCVGVQFDETAGCTRITENVDCGTDTVTSCGACGGFSTTCDEGGTQTCTCTDFKCQSDSCAPIATSCSQSCNRDTDGTMCSADTVTACGACNYSSECDESAVKTCTCNTFSCVTGGCVQASTSCQEPCTRVTDGASCCVPCATTGDPRRGSCNTTGSCNVSLGSCGSC